MSGKGQPNASCGRTLSITKVGGRGTRNAEVTPHLQISGSLCTCHPLFTYVSSPRSEVQFLPKGCREKSWVNLKNLCIIFYFALKSYNCPGAPGWLSWLSIQLLISARVMVSWFMGSRPESGSALTEIAWDSLSPSPSLSLST